MNRILTLIALTLACSAASAADEWASRDKLQHAALSAGIAAAATAVTKDERIGFAAAVAVGVAKELYDASNRDKHTPSWKDLAADVAGAYVGAKLGGVVFIPQPGGLSVRLIRKF